MHVSWTRPFVQQSEEFGDLDVQAAATPVSTDTDGLPPYIVQEFSVHRPRGKGYHWFTHLAGSPRTLPKGSQRVTSSIAMEPSLMHL